LGPPEGGSGVGRAGGSEEQASAPQPGGQAAVPEHQRPEHHRLHRAVHDESQPLLPVQQTRYLLLWSAEHQEERLHRFAPEHAGLRLRAGAGGQWRIMMKGSLSLISWYNKGHFRFLTNGYSPTKQGGCCSGGRGGAGRRAWRSPRVCCRRLIIKRKSGEIPCPLAVEAFAAHLSYICKYDDKYSKWVESAGHVTPEEPEVLKKLLFVLLQVLYLPQTQQDVAAGLLAEHQHRHQQRLHPLQDVRRLRRQTPQPGAVWRDAGPRAAGPGPGLSHAVRRGRRRSRSRSRSRRRSRRTL
ncbi:unnamed protein product, partial [Tetraodon nigroviridis]